VARRGAGAATGKRVVGASRAWRDAVEAATPQRRPSSARRAAPVADPVAAERADAERRAARDARSTEEWVLVEDVREDSAKPAPKATPKRQLDPAPIDLAGEVREQLSRAVGGARRERVEKRLAEAAEHFEADRFGDAARILKKLTDEAPTVAAVRELYGITLYRQEKWKAAARELEAFRLLADSTEQNPVLADCYRALRQWTLVDELWLELRQVSPTAELVGEGRIVMAGSLADRGQIVEATKLLEQGWSFPKKPKPHHLRRAYALADLYERGGEIPKSRALFEKLRIADPDFADVRERLRALD
jgi:tetratricopeptide (TPR) repeat protein